MTHSGKFRQMARIVLQPHTDEACHLLRLALTASSGKGPRPAPTHDLVYWKKQAQPNTKSAFSALVYERFKRWFRQHEIELLMQHTLTRGTAQQILKAELVPCCPVCGSFDVVERGLRYECVADVDTRFKHSTRSRWFDQPARAAAADSRRRLTIMKRRFWHDGRAKQVFRYYYHTRMGQFIHAALNQHYRDLAVTQIIKD